MSVKENNTPPKAKYNLLLSATYCQRTNLDPYWKLILAYIDNRAKLEAWEVQAQDVANQLGISHRAITEHFEVLEWFGVLAFIKWKKDGYKVLKIYKADRKEIARFIETWSKNTQKAFEAYKKENTRRRKAIEDKALVKSGKRNALTSIAQCAIVDSAKTDDKEDKDNKKEKDNNKETVPSISTPANALNDMETLLADGYYEKSEYPSIVPGPAFKISKKRFQVPYGMDDKITKPADDWKGIEDTFTETILQWNGAHVPQDIIQKRIAAFKLQADNVHSRLDVIKAFKVITDKEGK
jgi:hypothetical protein